MMTGRNFIVACGLLAIPLCGTVIAQRIASASTFTYSRNLVPIGESPRPVTSPPGVFNSDLAFWGNTAFHGNYEGFRIIDITSPAKPTVIADFKDCVEGSTIGNQGDMVVWGNILVRSWNSPAMADTLCGGVATPAGQQGVHVFDISNLTTPVGVAFVRTPCGSHTATAVPDPANNRLLVYSSGSSASCPWIDIIQVPLGNPEAAGLIGTAPTGRQCHDTGVILGAAMRAACAGGDGVTVLALDGAQGGSLDQPAFLYSIPIPDVSVGHSASFTWDGRVLIFGHEPGGGSQARCQATSSLVDRSLFFFDSSTGALLGTFTHPRPQSATENCTWHNFNVVPISNRYVLVSGNYQSGILVVDFTDPANAREVAFADPAPLAHPTNPDGIVVGGDWATYWYNGFIYESDITRGLLVWRLSDPSVAGALRLSRLNPQTQEFTIQ